MMRFFRSMMLSACLAGTNLSLVGVDSVAAVKAEFFTQANLRLEQAQAKFLAHFGLDAKGLDDPEMTETISQIIENDNYAQVKEFQSMKLRCRMACQRLCHPRQTQALAAKQAALEVLAQKTLAAAGLGEVKIQHDATLGSNVGVVRCASLNQTWIMVDVECYANMPERFVEILWHEASHAIHQDTLLKQKLGCLAYTTAASCPGRVEIERVRSEFDLACEMRADALAVLNSPDHGQFLIAVLEDFLAEEVECGSGVDPDLFKANLRSRIEILRALQVELTRGDKK